MNKRSLIFAQLLMCGLLISGAGVQAELSREPFGQVKTLPVPYPSHWVIAHDAAFFHMSAGKMVVLDADARTQPEQFKGMFDTSLIGTFIQSTKRPEMYVGETFYSRGTRGERTDVVTIYDKANLAPIGEIVLPGGKKASTMPERFALQLIDNEKLLLVFNLTPATSVTVIDIVNRKILNEVPIPGCSLIYPTGKRGFSSLCSNGSLYSVQLDKTGQVKEKHRVDTFFDVDKAPLFEKPVYVKNVAYFPSFLGDVQPIDMKRSKPKLKKSWSLLTEEERKSGWRPSGWQLNAVDGKGKMYILMNPEGKDGSHKDGGSEVWVYDVKKKKRVNKIVLKIHGVSIAVTQDKSPLMLVTNAQMGVDVYQVKSGEYQQTMNFGQETPFVVYPSR
jgi:methylamine dehydrogenase heavy chain